MSVQTDLRDLQLRQAEVGDGYRLFYDGTIKIQSLTEMGNIGWYILARSIPGATTAFKRYFSHTPEGIFLKTEDMREAIAIRDLMMISCVEARVNRQNDNALQNPL